MFPTEERNEKKKSAVVHRLKVKLKMSSIVNAAIDTWIPFQSISSVSWTAISNHRVTINVNIYCTWCGHKQTHTSNLEHWTSEHQIDIEIYTSHSFIFKLKLCLLQLAKSPLSRTSYQQLCSKRCKNDIQHNCNSVRVRWCCALLGHFVHYWWFFFGISTIKIIFNRWIVHFDWRKEYVINVYWLEIDCFY